ncbi:MAG: tRNA (adenosine(37)-N6)-threonylcarbamoyltransferase complex dimerization subunit type 1 TsaB [Mycoplasmataceae bacterium]|jgi:tRNA threonylcarbamoyl adenosine modification protein YeaZ|nr:tRNA (adenosine(37)-N6)-threonylcarbamoyltransferase complex dimerization subunit type 1 TsaB [Mycoplasmataceae bacterium]
MLNLFIDCSNKECILAIAENERIIKYQKILSHNNLTEIIIKHLQTLLYSISLHPRDCKNVYVVYGPGSFTGIRIACLIAKAWASIFRCNIYIISSLWFQLPCKDGISIIDAHGQMVFVAVYKNNRLQFKPQLMSSKDINKIIDKYPSRVFKYYENINIVHLFAFHYQHFKLINPSQLKPLYIKKPV